MTGRRGAALERVPAAATILYALGLLAVAAVSLSLGGGETAPARWAAVAIPVLLVASASLVARRATRRQA